MKLIKSFIAFKLILVLISISFLSLLTHTVSAQDSKIALQRGYRTGYSDGYMAGYRDVIENSQKSFEKHREFIKADRAFNESYGNKEDYRDGYQQGFETGYNTGFEKRTFDAALPEGLTKRGTVSAKTSELPKSKTPKPPVFSKKQTEPEPIPVQNNNTDEKIIIIPAETEIVVELLGDLNTNSAKEGDKFQAKVVSPYEINGAMIEGRVTKVQKPGRIKKRAELQFTFDQIRLSENRWANYNATLMEVIPNKEDNVKMVDNEGTVKGKGTLKSDGVKVGAATGTGLVVGAVVGGPVGAAVGAGLGAAFGLGGVLVERGKNINLIKGQQMRVRTAYETQIR
jgi:hypothetical protein